MALRSNGLKGEFKSLGVGFDFEGVQNLISDLQYLKSHGIYDEFFEVFKNWEEPIDITTSKREELNSISPLLTRAISNNFTPEKANVFSGSIDYYSFYHFYRFLEWVYSMNLGRNLLEEDVKAIFSSDILEKIILGLENFSRVKNTNEFNDGFFNDIKHVKWTDKYTEGFFDKLYDLLASRCFNEAETKEVSFKREIKRIIKFLTTCIVVNKEKIYITTAEVISAFKLFFKIIRTDITNLVNKKVYKGVLACPTCNGYYQLDENETPDDFIHCNCGGTLQYTMSLEDIKHYADTFKEIIMDEKGLIAGAITSLTFALIFDNILLLTLMSGFITVLLAKNYTNAFRYGFLTGSISGSLFSIAVFIFGTIISGIKLNHISSLDDSIVFIFILVLGVLAIYCGRIGTFLIKSKNNTISPL